MLLTSSLQSNNFLMYLVCHYHIKDAPLQFKVKGHKPIVI